MAEWRLLCTRRIISMHHAIGFPFHSLQKGWRSGLVLIRSSVQLNFLAYVILSQIRVNWISTNPGVFAEWGPEFRSLWYYWSLSRIGFVCNFSWNTVKCITYKTCEILLKKPCSNSNPLLFRMSWFLDFRQQEESILIDYTNVDVADTLPEKESDNFYNAFSKCKSTYSALFPKLDLLRSYPPTTPLFPSSSTIFSRESIENRQRWEKGAWSWGLSIASLISGIVAVPYSH